ncbi:MAG TPA: hypothetical protein VFC90_12320 [Planctomycetota bacterium]|nr:hypothetical protein [Planctomycetota bacterium]
MAIAKIEKRSSTVWSRESVITAGIAAVLGLVSLILLWSAVKSFMVRTSYVEAAFKYDSNRRQDVRANAERARAWGRHPESTELLAKVLVEGNQLDAAEKLYVETAAGPRRAMGLVGQGLILLRRADGEKDPKKGAELSRKAKDRFTEAKAADKDLVEAHIGSATADLVTGVKLNDPAKIAAARSEFVKILKSLLATEATAAGVTREGYMDLFVGLARSHASPTKFSPDALAHAGAARRYLPSSMNLYAMELALQAQMMVESPPATAEIRAAKTYEKLKFLKDRLVSARDQKPMENVADSWFALTLATAAVLARGGSPEDIAGSKEFINLAQQGPRGTDNLLAAVLEASLAMAAAQMPLASGNWNKRQTNYQQAYGHFSRLNGMKEVQEPSRALLRATLLNNQAFFEEDTAVQGGGEPRYEQAVGLLKKALEAEKQGGLPNGSYEVLRNLAVIQRRRGKPDAAEHYQAALAAGADRSEEWVKKDVEELQKYFLAGSK